MTAPRLGLAGALAGVVLFVPVLTFPGSAAETSPRADELDVGTATVSERRSSTTLQPGVTLTTIVRGHHDADDFWTVETAIPAGSGSPDPDAPPRAISDEASARRAAAELREAGFDPRVERVVTERVADFGGLLGYRVRVGTYGQKADADAAAARVRESTDLTGSSLYTGWDPDEHSTGPWRIHVLTVDPRSFEGRLVGSYGPDLERRETTSTLATTEGASAAVNAGFFVFDPAAGAPGDPAGVGMYGGRLLSESVDGRPALVFDDDAGPADVQRFRWEGRVRSGRQVLRLDGVNRVPGLIRNCGGTVDDAPTDQPLHDFTCTDAHEVVLFDSAFGASTPEGPGTEAVLDARGVVVDVRPSRGGAVPPGGSTLQATGTQARALQELARVGRRLEVSSSLVGADGRRMTPSPSTYVLNGGPELVDDGRLQVTPRADGMVRPDDPSFYYGWAHKRNPRTLAGTDAAGRLLLVTVDGRSTDSLGLSAAEAGELALDVGMQDAVNLDGGGSTTMVAGGRVVNDPSDASGERPVGDAVLVLPR